MANKKFILLLAINLIIFSLCAEPEEPKKEEEPTTEEKLPPMDERNVVFKSEHILTITASDYKKYKEGNESIMVLIYAEFCGHCHRFAPTFSQLADKLTEEKFPFKFGAMDGVKYHDFLTNENVQGYPTIRIFFNGTMTEYEGERTVSAISKFLNRVVNGPVIKVNTLEELEKIQSLNPLVLLCTINPETSEDYLKEEYKAFVKFASNDTFKHNTFVSCFSEECFKKYPKRVVYLRQYDEPVIVIEENLPVTTEELYIMDRFYRWPIAGNFSEEAAEYMFDGNRTTLFYFRDPNNKEQVAKDELFHEYSLYWRVTAISFIIDIESDPLCESTANYFGIDKEDLPALLIVQPEGDTTRNYKFPMKTLDDMKRDDMDEWMNQFLFSHLKPTPKSEGRPKKQNEDYRVVVAKTFKEEVIDNEMNVALLAINADFPEPQEKYKEQWDIAIRALKNKKENGIVLAGIDLSLNDVDGFPKDEASVKLYKKGDKQNPIVFEQKNSEDLYEIADWITEKLGLPKCERLEETKKDEEEKAAEANKKEEEKPAEETPKKEEEPAKKESKSDL